ncbi:hypothetical protein [Ekhidna sp.]
MKKVSLLLLLIGLIVGACGSDNDLDLFPPYGEILINDYIFIPEHHVLVKEYNSFFDFSTYQFILSDMEVSYNPLSERFSTEENAYVLYISLSSIGNELTNGDYELDPFDAQLKKRINAITVFSPDDSVSFGPILNQSVEVDVKGSYFKINFDSIKLFSPDRLINGTLEGKFDNVFSPLI